RRGPHLQVRVLVPRRCAGAAPSATAPPSHSAWMNALATAAAAAATAGKPPLRGWSREEAALAASAESSGQSSWLSSQEDSGGGARRRAFSLVCAREPPALIPRHADEWGSVSPEPAKRVPASATPDPALPLPRSRSSAGAKKAAAAMAAAAAAAAAVAMASGVVAPTLPPGRLRPEDGKKRVNYTKGAARRLMAEAVSMCEAIDDGFVVILKSRRRASAADSSERADAAAAGAGAPTTDAGDKPYAARSKRDIAEHYGIAWSTLQPRLGKGEAGYGGGSYGGGLAAAATDPVAAATAAASGAAGGSSGPAVRQSVKRARAAAAEAAAEAAVEAAAEAAAEAENVGESPRMPSSKSSRGGSTEKRPRRVPAADSAVQTRASSVDDDDSETGCRGRGVDEARGNGGGSNGGGRGGGGGAATGAATGGRSSNGSVVGNSDGERRLPEAVERLMTEHVMWMLDGGYSVTLEGVADCARQLGALCNVACFVAGESWLAGFAQRHPELARRCTANAAAAARCRRGKKRASETSLLLRNCLPFASLPDVEGGGNGSGGGGGDAFHEGRPPGPADAATPVFTDDKRQHGCFAGLNARSVPEFFSGHMERLLALGPPCPPGGIDSSGDDNDDDGGGDGEASNAGAGNDDGVGDKGDAGDGNGDGGGDKGDVGDGNGDDDEDDALRRIYLGGDGKSMNGSIASGGVGRLNGVANRPPLLFIDDRCGGSGINA
ncbi:unnamed protein product, partial [Phaeothamnion confervicola]